jgi:hypothetical protein
VTRNATAHAHVLWMDLDGDIYSPEMSLSRATAEMIERDIWNGIYPGVCHAVYSYGTYANGGSYCSEVTQDVATRLGRMSFAGRRGPAEPARAFLDAMGIAYFDEGRAAPQEWPKHQPFELQAPNSPGSPVKRSAPQKRRSRSPSPPELRAQPQFKLPIAGGKDSLSPRLESTVERERSAPLSAATESDEDAGVEVLSLKDTRPLAEQVAAWKGFHQKMREMGVKVAGNPGDELPGEEGDADPARRSAKA